MVGGRLGDRLEDTCQTTSILITCCMFRERARQNGFKYKVCGWDRQCHRDTHKIEMAVAFRPDGSVLHSDQAP